MKTTQKTAISAHNALVEIGKLPFPIRDALSLLKLKKALETAYEFQLQEEQKLVDEYHPTVNGNKLTMPYDENDEEVKNRAKEFFQKLADLNKMEIDVDIDPVFISIPEGVSIKPETLLALDGFVEWGD